MSRLRALLIHKGTKRCAQGNVSTRSLRALLIHKGTKQTMLTVSQKLSLRALLIHKGTKLNRICRLRSGAFESFVNS